MGVLILAACSPAGGKPGNNNQPSANPPEANGATLTTNQETAVASAVTPSKLENTSSSTLWVKILEPLDDSTVNSSQVELKGQAPIGTTITINDAIVYTESSQDFSVTLNLVNGANLFEIIASDINNNEVTLYLTVYYEP